MRKSSFKKMELVKLEHPKAGNMYVPRINLVQLMQLVAPAVEFSEYIAVDELKIDREFYESKPTTKDFTEIKDFGFFWEGRKAPKDLYEEKIYNSITQKATMLMLTMFICDEKGDCICPFTERMGEDISNERYEFFTQFALGNDNFNKKISGILFGKSLAEIEIEIEMEKGDKKGDETEFKVEESPNEQSPKEKMTKKKVQKTT